MENPELLLALCFIKGVFTENGTKNSKWPGQSC